MAPNRARVAAVRAALSHARMSTYEAAVRLTGDDDLRALELYAWNAELSGAFLAPLHICEVVIRNATAEALERQYGARWPWSPGFERSLPTKSRVSLHDTRAKYPTTGQVIAELNFGFWQKMFTDRHDSRLWNTELTRVLPRLNSAHAIPVLRKAIYDDLEVLRGLRNRIAHHEPIFSRNLTDDLQRITDLIGYRCDVTAHWMTTFQRVSTVLAARP